MTLEPPSALPRGQAIGRLPVPGLGLERKLPREARVVDRAEVADRQAQPEVARVAAGLEQQDAAGRVGGQPVGEHAARPSRRRRSM